MLTTTNPHLGLADWDLGSLFENAGTYAKNVGGSFLMLMGIVGLVWGGTLLIKKLMSSQQDNTSWGKIIMLFIAGGALAVGGFQLVFMIGSGGQKTIEDLGGGLVHLSVWAQILTGHSLELAA